MRHVQLLAIIFSLVGVSPVPSAQGAAMTHPRIQSEILTTQAGDMVVSQEVVIHTSVDRVWDAYTTEEGWRAWASPHVDIDLRVGGTIRTHYGTDASVGDPGTNTLHILNIVPQRVLTLQAEVEDRWPDVMKEDADRLMNVVIFEALGNDRARIRSYGVGYRDTEAYREVMEFFIPANEGLFLTLLTTLEE